MKKKWIRIGVVILAVGIAVLLSGFAMMGFSLEPLKANGIEQGSIKEKVFQDASEIILSVDNEDIELKTIAGNQVKINFPEEQFSVQEKKGTITLNVKRDQNQKKRWYQFFQTNVTNSKISVGVPENYTGQLMIDSKYGNITCDGLKSQFEDVEIISQDSNIKLFDLNTKRLQVEGGYGSLICKNIKTEGIQVEITDGEINFDEVETENFQITSQYGTQNINGIKAQNVLFYLRDGDLNVSNYIAEKTEIQMQYGTLKCDNIDSQISNISVDDGEVILENLAGSYQDYAVQVMVEDGDSNLKPRFDGDRQLAVTIQYGNIKAGFREE